MQLCSQYMKNCVEQELGDIKMFEEDCSAETACISKM